MLTAAFLDAILYVMSERALSADKQLHPPTAAELTYLSALLNLLASGTYVTAYTALGFWGDWVTDPIKQQPCDSGGLGLIIAGWASTAVANMVHYLSFYYCVERSDAVATGVNKAAQSVTVFFLSDLLFCGPGAASDEDDGCTLAGECLRTRKVVSAFVVFGGVFIYALGYPRRSRDQPGADRTVVASQSGSRTLS